MNVSGVTHNAAPEIHARANPVITLRLVRILTCMISTVTVHLALLAEPVIFIPVHCFVSNYVRFSNLCRNPLVEI